MYKILTMNARHRKLLFYKRHTEDLIMFIFKILKHNCFTPSQICHSFFLRMEISIRPDSSFT